MKLDASTYRCDRVGLDVILGALERKCLGEGDETHLCRAVVGLSKITYAGKTTPKILSTAVSYRIGLRRSQC